ncbi:MAG: YqeG family HAD IIIA-type phosphatase [Oscillospiraceae bacterium]|nr:YqeG family HAD IIIA-type phosphatase [Oscillospiraceae bacterium]
MIDLFGFFTPDIMFGSVYDIDFGELGKKNIKGVIFDIDNTLVSYRQEEPTQNVAELINKLTGAGFKICFVSNNTKQRVDAFLKGFGEPGFLSYPNAGKPFAKYIREALRAMELKPDEAVLVGDQLFTDVAAAKRAKIMSVTVTPIEPVETLFFKLKRFLEKPIIKRYYRRINK